MAVEKKVNVRGDVFPEGTAVQAFPALTTDVERREKRTPIPAKTASGTIKDGAVTFKGLTAETDYVMTGVVNEVQSIKVEAKKGKFKLTYSGKTTAGIKYNATAAEVKEALEALENIAAGEVEVTGGPGDEGGTKPYVIKFLDTLSGTNQPAITADVTELEEEPKKVTITTTTEGSKSGASGIQRSYKFRSPAE